MHRMFHLAGRTGLLLVTSAAIAQTTITLPPHLTVWNGISLGWRTTVQTPFAITGVSLPPEAFQQGDTAGYLVLVNGSPVLHSYGNAGAIATTLLVETGDELTVIGNWSPATVTNASAHNSVAYPNGPVAIEGVPHTLVRAGWHWDISDPSYGGSLLGANAGTIGRVFITTAATTGYATRTTLGPGCHELPRMVHERFAPTASATDLANTHWVLDYVPTVLGGHYSISPGGPSYDAIGPAQNGVDLTTQPPTASSGGGWTNASAIRTLPIARFPNGFPFPAANGTATPELTINSNGRVLLGHTTSNAYEVVGAPNSEISRFTGSAGSGLATIAGWYCDLDPAAGGHVYYEDSSPGGGVRITWHDVPVRLATSLRNDVQIELLPNGRVHLAFGPNLAIGGSGFNDAYVGFSAGGGEPVADAVDWSSLSGYLSGDGSSSPMLRSDARPIMGTVVTLTVDDAMPQSPLAALALGVQQLAPALPLDAVGMPGCALYADPDVIHVFNPTGGSASHTLNIPTLPALAGQSLATQAMVLNVAYRNPLRAAVSRGLLLTFDVQ